MLKADQRPNILSLFVTIVTYVRVLQPITPDLLHEVIILLIADECLIDFKMPLSLISTNINLSKSLTILSSSSQIFGAGASAPFR